MDLMTNKDILIADIKDKISKLEEAERLINRAKALLAMDKAKLKEVCNGSCVHLVRKEEYYPGGYLDKSMTEYIDTCSICGYYKVVDIIKYLKHNMDPMDKNKALE